jgi:serine/threonine protein kinase
MAGEAVEETFSGVEKSSVSTYVAVERMVGGGTSNVYKVEIDGTSYAVKASPFSLEKEKRILSKVTHPHILPVLTQGQAKLDTSQIPDDRNNGVVVNTLRFKFVPNSLSNQLENCSQEERIAILQQQREALDFIHSKGIVHKDIKSDNVLIDGETSYLADFGNAEEFNLPEREEEFEIKRKKDNKDFEIMAAQVTAN